MESKEQVERIKELLPNCTEREIYEALDYCKMDSDAAAERLLSRVETEKNRGAVPMEGKEKVERVKKMVPRIAEEKIREVLKQCDMDSNLAIHRLLSQETGKNIERSPMERKEQFECIKEMVPLLTEEDREGVPTEWKEQVEHIKEMTPCFTGEIIYKMLKQCYIDSELTLPGLLSPETPCNTGSPLNDFSSPPSSAKSSVASQLHTVSLDKGKDVVWHTEDDAATTSRSNVRALRVMGPRSSHALQAASDPMALGNNVALGSSEFLEYELFPPPTQQLTLNDLVANADQPSELRHLLPFLETPSLPSRSSAAGSQHPQTSASESGPSEATPSNSATSHIQPFRDPQDPVLDAPFACSRYGPIQRPVRMSENAHPFPSSASVLRSPKTLSLGNNMSTGRGFPRPYIEPSFYEPQLPLQQYGYMDGDDNMHQNFAYDMSSAQQEAHEGGSSSRANADASDIPHGSLTISPAPSDISRTEYDFALHAQDQHQLRDDYRPAEMNCDDAGWNHQPDSGAISALPKLQLGSFPGWVPLPAKANNQRGKGYSPQYAYRGCQASNFLKRASCQTISSKAHMIWPPRDLKDP